MIDTNKYEGHATVFHVVIKSIDSKVVDRRKKEGREKVNATYNLVTDAPLLLAEVKRLRDFIQSVWDGLGEAGRNEHYELFKEYMGEEEE